LLAKPRRHAIASFALANSRNRNDAFIHQEYERALLHQLRWKEAAGYYHKHSNKTGEYDPSGMFKHWTGENCERAVILATGGYGDAVFVS